jgi:hypothetical protein
VGTVYICENKDISREHLATQQPMSRETQIPSRLCLLPLYLSRTFDHLHWQAAANPSFRAVKSVAAFPNIRKMKRQTVKKYITITSRSNRTMFRVAIGATGITSTLAASNRDNFEARASGPRSDLPLK